MTDPRRISDEFFFTSTGLDAGRVIARTRRALHGADGGELYMQHHASRSLGWFDGMLRGNHYTMSEGFMMRYVADDATGYATSNGFTDKNLAAAAKNARQIRNYRQGTGGIVLPMGQHAQRLYPPVNPLDDFSVGDTVRLMEALDKDIRAMDPAITQVGINITSGFDIVTIIRQDGRRLDDVRPMTTVSISMDASRNGRAESSHAAFGGRGSLRDFFVHVTMQDLVDRAFRQLQVKLDAIPAPAGQLPVILGPGPAAVMLHEAVGHGLEGDFNRIGSSAFSGRVGQRVASPGVTIIDQGDLGNLIPGYRGSLMFDDEGVPTQTTVLIEDGILKGYMQDSLNARLMGVAPTGNGRREDYNSLPIPRMTTTCMLPGKVTQDEMIASVKGKAIFAKQFGGGQVDIVTGKFVFVMEEAYLVENGRIVAPVRGATLIGDGPTAMQKIDMIGNDMVIDNGTWTCGKGGQSVPVGVGQPSLRMRGLTVGGT